MAARRARADSASKAAGLAHKRPWAVFSVESGLRRRRESERLHDTPGRPGVDPRPTDGARCPGRAPLVLQAHRLAFSHVVADTVAGREMVSVMVPA